MYNIVIWHLNTLWVDHHDKFSNHLASHKVITVLLTIYYISKTYLLNKWSLYLFTYFTQLSTSPPNPRHPHSWPLVTRSLFSVSMSLFLVYLVCSFVFCFVLFFNWRIIALQCNDGLLLYINANQSSLYIYSLSLLSLPLTPHL